MMNDRRKTRSAAIWFAHPGFTFFVSILSLASSIGSAVLLSCVGEEGRVRLILATAIDGNDFDLAVVRVIARSFSHNWLSVIIGITVGVPCMLLCRRMTGGHVEFLAGLYAMPFLARLRRPVLKINLFLALCTLLPMVLSGVICWYARISIIPALLAAYVPYAILYPEHRRIYDLARAKLSSIGA
ncbi:MAG: hypothetical protein NTU88_12535 [Armatimonadetes bacterium]|nr:hypothetical protein [Armatimonadota bacterium]